MFLRFQRLLIAVMFALLAAGVTLVVVKAQDGGPGSPSSPAAPTQQNPPCVACHTEFATEWENGRRAKENAMNATEILLVMFLLRVVLPVSLLLWIGEKAHQRQLANLHRVPGGL